MKINYVNRISSVSILIICMILTSCNSNNQLSKTSIPAMESDFDRNQLADEWQLKPGEIVWSSEEFITGSLLTDGITAYYISPNKFFANWMDYSILEIVIRSEGGKFYDSGYGMTGDVFLSNGNFTAQINFGKRPDSAWDTFRINLKDNSNWQFGGGATSLSDILDNVTDFKIRAEYGVGEDTSELNRVALIPVPVN